MSKPALYLRSCPRCAAHIGVPYSTDRLIYCKQCRPIVESAEREKVEKGDHVRYITDPPTRTSSSTRYIVVAAEGDTLTLQQLGFPDKRWQEDRSQVLKLDRGR